MKSKRVILFFLILSALAPLAYAADYGEDEDYLGQIVDDYENDDNIAAMIATINNVTLDCMELNYTETGTNFDDYIEVDEDGDITVSSDRIDWLTLRRDAVTYVYGDYGVDYFGDFALNYTFCFTDIEAGDGSNQHILDCLSFSNGIGAFETTSNDWLGVMTAQNGGINDRFRFRVIQYTGGVNQFVANGAYRNIDVFYLTFDRVGTTIRLRVYSDSERTVLIETISSSSGNVAKYRYLYGVQNSGNPIGSDPADHSTGYIIGEFVGESGYVGIGTYYTTSVLDGDPALAIIYNLTIPAGGGATMEFSTDNVTWVDHNNQAGSDNLIAGYEALDLRDIYNGTIYRRVNMTSDGSDTPRMYQVRWVTVTTITAAGGDLFPGLAIGIGLLIIGAILALEKRR